MSVPPKVCAVVVTFYPDAERFASVLAALASQVAVVVVVDNGGAARDVGALCAGAAPTNCVFLPQQNNIGVAAGQNSGIRWAVAAQADYVLLLDHDSVPAPDMVERLRSALEAAARQGRRVAAAGPLFTDDQSSATSYFVRFGPLGFQRLRCGGQDRAQVINADFLISSGTLIPAAALQAIGLMKESLFIDHVDTEWCLRARDRAYELLGVCAARMSHRLGERSIALGPAGSRPYYVHGPLRHYYTFRNSLLLYRLPHAPLRWVLGDMMRLLLLFAALATVAAPRLRNILAALQGLADGIRGRSGPAIEFRP
jgi:rhamnosyltransferase